MRITVNIDGNMNINKTYYILGFFKASDELCNSITDWQASSVEKKRPIWVNAFTLSFLFSKRDLQREIPVWLKAIFSLTGFWAFLFVLLGVAIVYYAQSNGDNTQTWKGLCEVIALWLMGATTALFLLRVILFRMKMDIVLLALAVSFLCREIHFTGTHRGIYYAIAIIGVWTWLWRDKLLEEVNGKKQLKVAMFCMCWSYFIAILIQKRVFREKRLPLLPHEDLLHVPLEEVTENFSHTAFFLLGLISFFFPKKKKKEDTTEKT